MITVTYTFSIEEDKIREMYEEDGVEDEFEDYLENVIDDMSICDVEEFASNYDKSISFI